jgi:(2R)-3-sulfolactate dehydrogenase (NADP+)
MLLEVCGEAAAGCAAMLREVCGEAAAGCAAMLLEVCGEAAAGCAAMPPAIAGFGRARENRVRTTVAGATELTSQLLQAAGMPEGPARRTAWAVVTAEAWGKRSHGLLRVPYYLARLAAGGSDARASLRTVRDTGPVVALDGGNGLGHWQAWDAAALAAERAVRFGVAAVSVGNSGHCGALGCYVLPMVEAGLVGVVFSNGPAVMPPWGGREAVFSTSPIAAGIPARPRPAIVDLATSAVARGTVAEAAAAGRALPEGWAFDAGGAPTTDPVAALAGMLAPMAGAKGAALAFLVEALTGGIVGPSLSAEVADPLASSTVADPQRIAHLLIALDPGSLDVDGHGEKRLTGLADRIVAVGGRLPGAGHPLPGELDGDRGLEIADKLAARLADEAGHLNVPLPSAWPRTGTR